MLFLSSFELFFSSIGSRSSFPPLSITMFGAFLLENPSASVSENEYDYPSSVPDSYAAKGLYASSNGFLSIFWFQLTLLNFFIKLAFFE